MKKLCLLITLLFSGQTLAQHEAIARLEQLAAKQSFTPEKFKDTLLLRYRGLHFGDHPITTYEKVDKISTAKINGNYVWKRERIETHDGDKQVTPIAMWETAFDPANLSSVFENFKVDTEKMQQNMSLGKDLVVYQLQFGDKKINLNRPKNDLQIGYWNLDMLLMNSPLTSNFKTNFQMASHNGQAVIERKVRVEVERSQTYRINQRNIEAYRVNVIPQDGSNINKSVYLVTTAFPHLVLRQDYVVQRKTEGSAFDSTGTDSLVEVKIIKNIPSKK